MKVSNLKYCLRCKKFQVQTLKYHSRYKFFNTIHGTKNLRYEILNTIQGTKNPRYDIVNTIQGTKNWRYAIRNTIQGMKKSSCDRCHKNHKLKTILQSWVTRYGDFHTHISHLEAVSYTHMTLPTKRKV